MVSASILFAFVRCSSSYRAGQMCLTQHRRAKAPEARHLGRRHGAPGRPGTPKNMHSVIRSEKRHLLCPSRQTFVTVWDVPSFYNRCACDSLANWYRFFKSTPKLAFDVLKPAINVVGAGHARAKYLRCISRSHLPVDFRTVPQFTLGIIA